MSLVSILLNKLLIFFSNKNTIRYTKIFSNLSKQDKKFVLAMAQSSNERVTIKATNYGEVAFTLPFF